jgi:hypothetical protein
MNNFTTKLALMIAWPIVAPLLFSLVVAMVAVIGLMLIVIWPLIPFMTLSRTESGGWELKP